MKKVLIVLLVIGLLVGSVCAAAGAEEEISQEGFSVWNNDSSPDPGVTPCGGGDGGGGGAPD
ncbi:MAG: hypothetical protein WBA22_12800 [Candidatus Methanofastidiosia archaeon]